MVFPELFRTKVFATKTFFLRLAFPGDQDRVPTGGVAGLVAITHFNGLARLDGLVAEGHQPLYCAILVTVPLSALAGPT